MPSSSIDKPFFEKIFFKQIKFEIPSDCILIMSVDLILIIINRLENEDRSFQLYGMTATNSRDESTIRPPLGAKLGHKSDRRSNAEKLGLVPNASPTRSWKPGRVWIARDGIFPKTAKCLNVLAPFESSLEARAHLLLSVDHRVHSYVCQPPALHYWMPSGNGGQDKRQYTPDFVALTKDDRLLVIDAKARRFAGDAKWLKREPYIRETYRSDYAAEFIIWTETELCAEPRLTNARTMYRHRFAPKNRDIEFALCRLLGTEGQTSTIGLLCDDVSRELKCEISDVFGSIMRMALEGWIELESSDSYKRETAVTLGEIA